MNLFPHAFLATALCLFVASCATEPAGPVLPPFAEQFAAATAVENPYCRDTALTELLSRTDLSPADRAEALYERASLRRLDGNDRPGAVADYEALLVLAPAEDLAARAGVELVMTREDLAALQARLARLQSLPDWFSTTWSLGQRAAPALRYQKSGISPSERAVWDLQQAGFICDSTGEGGPVQGHGDHRDDLDGLTWCLALPA